MFDVFSFFKISPLEEKMVIFRFVTGDLDICAKPKTLRETTKVSQKISEIIIFKLIDNEIQK
jgi:hypothetical protein